MAALSFRTVFGTGIAAFILLSPSIFGQDAKVAIVPRPRLPVAVDPESNRVADLRVDVPLVLIPVHVTTPFGSTVADLNKDKFRLFENGVEQRISHFFREDGPISIGVLFDVSGSMRNKTGKSSEAVRQFFRVANPEDEFFLVEFNDKPKLTVAFTNDPGDVQRRISHAGTFGRTSLLDAISLALTQMRQARHTRKALLIVSDGGNNRSRHSEGEIRGALLEADIQLYALGIFEQAAAPPATREEREGPELLSNLAEETGGKLFSVDDLTELPKVCTRIGMELRDQYVLGYSPSNPERDGKYRRIQVTVASPGDGPLKPYYRLGYYAPNQ